MSPRTAPHELVTALLPVGSHWRGETGTSFVAFIHAVLRQRYPEHIGVVERDFALLEAQLDVEAAYAELLARAGEDDDAAYRVASGQLRAAQARELALDDSDPRDAKYAALDDLLARVDRALSG